MSAAEEAYRNLAAAARADGDISPAEGRILNAYEVRLGLDAARARELRAAAEAETPPRIHVPPGGKERLDTLRAVLELSAADGSISPRELAVARALADRLSFGAKDLERLTAAALRRSKNALDKAFAGLRVSDLAGADVVDFAAEGARDRSREVLRSLPFAARLAPAVRYCGYCRQSFAARDPYDTYCRTCRLDLTDPVAAGRRGEWLTGVLWLVLLVPSAYAVEHATGLWSWGYEALVANAPERAFNRRGKLKTGHAVYIMPAAAVSVALAWGVAWGIGALYMLLVNRRGPGYGKTSRG